MLSNFDSIIRSTTTKCSLFQYEICFHIASEFGIRRTFFSILPIAQEQEKSLVLNAEKENVDKKRQENAEEENVNKSENRKNADVE